MDRGASVKKKKTASQAGETDLLKGLRLKGAQSECPIILGR